MPVPPKEPATLASSKKYRRLGRIGQVSQELIPGNSPQGFIRVSLQCGQQLGRFVSMQLGQVELAILQDGTDLVDRRIDENAHPFQRRITLAQPQPKFECILPGRYSAGWQNKN